MDIYEITKQLSELGCSATLTTDNSSIQFSVDSIVTFESVVKFLTDNEITLNFGTQHFSISA